MSTLSTDKDLLVVEDLVMHFPKSSGFLSGDSSVVRAVDGVSFSIPKGKTLSLVGESGCGKTTTGRLVLDLLKPTSGTVRYDGVELGTLNTKGMRSMRRRMQIIFQDPFSSLNPRMSVAQILGEALKIHGIGTKASRVERVYELLELVGLPRESAGRYPHEFSGGQRQRIGIARALAVEPELIVADEPVSALDVSIQAQILNLMNELQKKFGLTYLFVGHDLSVIRHISDFVAVMYLGRIVEIGPVDEIFENPLHPYTQALLKAVPVTRPSLRRKREILEGHVPSPIDPPSGCHFHPRCSHCEAVCRTDDPRLREAEVNHRVACHLVTNGG
ncbi:MAG: dipeptide ABC transporter ATP-binding protein [Candidatus Hydrogenedentota bacterium]